MKVLVTGGGGFLGRYIVERLLDRGHKVVSLSRSRYPELDRRGVTTIIGSLDDFDVVFKATKGVDAVFHVAARVGIFGPWDEYFNANVTGTKNVIDACQKRGVHKLIYTSSPSVVFDGKDHEGIDEKYPYMTNKLAYYPWTKALAEQEVLKANGKNNLLTCALRPHLIWGPRDNSVIPRLIKRANAGKLKMVGSGKTLVDTTYVENAADAHLNALDNLFEGSAVAGSAYFISQGDPVNPWDFINRLMEACGAPGVKGRIPFPVAYAAGFVLENVYKLIGKTDEPLMTRFLAMEFATSHWFNIDKARQELDYEPAISIDEGLIKLAKSMGA